MMNWRTGELISVIATMGMTWQWSLHPSSGLVSLACGDKNVRLMDPALALVVRTIPFGDEVYASAFSPSGP